jgi:hypothetical protein
MLKSVFRKIVDFFMSGSNRSVIAICFLLSTLFWFLIKFSKEYTYYVDYPVVFVNQPIDKYLKDAPTSSLKVKVDGFGFNFLKEAFSSRSVEVDVSKLQRQSDGLTYFWLSQTEQANIALELNGFSILEIEPDTLFLNFSNKTKKRVEVEVPQRFSFRENYVEYGSFIINPTHVDVFGPSHILDTLSSIKTEILIREDIIDDISAKVNIILPHQLLSIRDSEINVSQDVARFTQINKVIPIKLKNVPRGKELRIKPAQVELSYWVAMQDVDKVKSTDFEVYCDYNEVAMTESAILNVFLNDAKTPSIVQRVKYHPSTIEFIKLK